MERGGHIASTAAGEAGRYFDRIYAPGADPWRQRSWYERRKRAVLLASLPGERYVLGWEPACGQGPLTEELATRCDQVLASDASASAVAQAQARLAGHPNVQVAQLVLPAPSPADVPSGCDLVVLSEFLYYLDTPDRESVLGQAGDALAAAGHLVVVHWAEQPHDARLSGPEVQREVQQTWPGRLLVRHREQDFWLDVYDRGGAHP